MITFNAAAKTALTTAAKDAAVASALVGNAVFEAANSIYQEAGLESNPVLDNQVWNNARGIMSLGYIKGYNQKAGITQKKPATQEQIAARESAFNTFASRIRKELESRGVTIERSQTEAAKAKAKQRSPEAVAKKAKADAAAHAKVAAVIEKEGGAPLVAALQAAKGDESKAKSMQAAYLRVERQAAAAAKAAHASEIKSLAADIREAVTTAVKEGDVDYLRRIGSAL